MNGVTKFTVSEDIALVTLQHAKADLKLVSLIFSDFASIGINIDMISQSVPVGGKLSISFTVPGSDFVKTLTMVNHYRDDYPDLQPMVSTGNCKLQLYGLDMPHTPGVAMCAIRAVSESGALVQLITTSEVDISILVDNCDFEQAVAALEGAFELTSQR